VTIIPWPTNRKVQRKRSIRKLIVDPLPEPVLHSLVADLPGPANETDAERAARFDVQLAEVLSHKPQDSAQAMMAAHAVMMRVVTEQARSEAAAQGQSAASRNKVLREVKQLDKLNAAMLRSLQERQKQPPAKMDPAMFVALGLEEFLIPDPDDPAQPDQAVSAVIVVLHPAPKMLQ
jgi:hypothetical protein